LALNDSPTTATAAMRSGTAIRMPGTAPTAAADDKVIGEKPELDV
jgi:hypothetical protein